MDIKTLALKLKKENIIIDLDEQSLNYPILKLEIKNYSFKFFYRENFIRRSKFHKRYNTFFEITLNNKSELLSVIDRIDKELSCKYCVDENKVYSNISNNNVLQIMNFIEKIK